MIQDLLLVAKILGAHGVSGELSVEIVSDDKHRFYEGLILVCRKENFPDLDRRVEAVRHCGKGAIMRLSGIDSREKAQKECGTLLYVKREDALPLASNEHFIADLLKLDVTDENFGYLGSVKEMFDTGAHYVVVTSKTGQRDLLFPFIKDVVLEINQEMNLMTVKLPDGLYEIYRELENSRPTEDS